MKIGQNKVVSVTYRLESSQDNVAPSLVEETSDDQPLVFLFGSGQLIPDFEKNLEGLEPGGKFNFRIASDNAYGNFDQEAVVNVSNDMFKVEGILDLEILRVGNMVPLLDNDGNEMTAKITGIENDNVTLDFNHPLAGHDLHFAGTVIDVREATKEELEHGHVHGDGMHDHH